ncbi:MAG TPA: PAS domain-containing sensor histidine kinase, partial [Novosphingobium sp.]|nr:PAS domain-containing sensor histidine kinase [Novosphingobium sp.]
VSDFLGEQARRLAPAPGRDEPEADGFDAVARQASRLHWLVEETADRREFLGRVIEAAPDAICVFDRAGALQLMNGRARAIFGECAPGLSFGDLLLTIRAHSQADGRELVLPDGRVLALSDSGEGRRGIRVVSLADIPDARRAEEDRRQMLEFLSHDMRAPQSAILGLAEERAGTAAPPDRLARIRGHARRTLKLADDFVQLSRLAEVPLDLAEIELVALVEEAIDNAWFVAREKRIELVSQVPDDPVWVRADGQVLLRAIDNLLSNAIRYGPPDSRVTLGLERERAKASLIVADEGPGLPPGRRDDPFRRFGPRDKGSGIGGAGLGLAFVQAAVARHGGTIAVRSSGKGTLFRMELVLLEAEGLSVP